MTDIFISYSRKDIAFARLIHQSLTENGLDSWIDWERIPVGEKWWSEIQQAIENANLFMVIISKHSVGSNVCKDEINIALNNSKKIIPIVIDDIAKESLDEFVPDLQKIQWIIFKHGDTFELDNIQNEDSDNAGNEFVAKAKRPQFDEAIKKLNIVIKTDWDWVKYHTQLQNEAHEWENNQKHTSYLLRGEALDKAEQSILAASNKEPSVTALQVEFITASKKQEKLERDEKLLMEQRSSKRLRWIIGVVVAGLIVAVFLGVNWLTQSNRAQKAEADALLQRDEAVQQAAIATSRQLSVQSTLLSQEEFDLPALLSIESNNIFPTNESKMALFTIINNHPRMLKKLNNHTDEILEMVFNTNGHLLISASRDDSVRLWDVTDPINAVEISEVVYGKEYFIDSLAISPDGNILAVGLTDFSTNKEYSYIDLYDISDEKSPEIVTSIYDDSFICSGGLEFSPDGKVLVSICSDYSIRVWDFADYNNPKLLLEPLIRYNNPISGVVFSPDGKTLITSSLDKKIHIWDFSDSNTPKLNGVIEIKSIARNLKFNSDGNILVSNEDNDDSIVFRDISNPQKPINVGTLHLVNESINEINFHPENLTYANIENDRINVYKVSTSMIQKISLARESKYPESLAVNKSGSVLASGNIDGKITLWDITDRNLQNSVNRVLPSQYTDVMGLFHLSEKEILVSQGSDKSIHFWDISKLEQVSMIWHPIGDTSKSYCDIGLRSDGKIAASIGDDHRILLWDISIQNTAVKIAELDTTHSGMITKLVFSPDGKLLVSAGSETIMIWDVSNPHLPKLGSVVVEGSWPYEINAVAFNPNGKILAAASDSTVRLWDISNPQNPQQIGQPIQGHSSYVKNLTFNAQGNILASGSETYIRLWDIANPDDPQPLGQPLIGFDSEITSISFSPNGELLASTGKDDVIHLWDISDPMRTKAIGISLNGQTMAFSPDGKTLASGSSDNTIRIWNLDVDFWKSQACAIANRNLTYSEWYLYLPEKPYQITCPNLPVSDASIRELTTLAKDALEQQDRTTAELAYTEALRKLAESDSEDYHNQICWFGSIDGFYALVASECDKAVSLSSTDDDSSNILDSRGLNRALNGDFIGAISDFQVFVDWSKENDLYDTYGKLREEWIASLREGTNPFDDETLNYLRTE